jgi:hypothetical protein
MGANMKLRNAAILKQNLGAVQNAILDTASELGVKSDELAQGKLVKEKDPRMMANFGAKMETAEDGSIVDYLKEVGKKSDFASRKLLAKDMGIKNYSGTAKQNMSLLEKIKGQNNQVYTPPTAVNLIDNTGPNYNWMTNTTPFPRPTGISNMPENIAASNITNPSETSIISPKEKTFAGKALQFLGKGVDKYGPTVLSNLAPLLRPRTQLDLDPEQLYPEYYSMATNQLEPVQAQTFQPMLDTPMDISLNDQLSAIDAQSRAAIRAAGQNPAAQAMIMSQSLEAKNKVLGEQTRINAANKMQTYDKNRAILNDAQLKNLQILDQQYVRQAQAKSNTKAQTLEALKSIAAKTAQNKLENQTLNVYENMYNYRFSPSGRAFNVNAPAQFNIPEGIGADDLTSAQADQIKQLYEKVVSRDKTGAITGSREKTRTTKQGRNGAIVQALKNL